MSDVVKYESQKTAKPLILVAVLLFFVQLIAGALLALYNLNPYILSGIANFNVIRSYHINALLLWLFSATFAVVIYIVPILSGRDMPSFTKLIPPYLLVVVIGIFITLPLFQSGYNIWLFNQPLLIEGREWVEAGRLWDILLFLGFIIFSLAVLMTLPPPKKWSIPIWALVLGAAIVFFLYIPGNIFFADLPLSEYFRWWTVHYWVEGALEVAYVGAIGLALILMIPDPRIKGIVEKYVFYDVVLAATSGIIGQGHHYFWIGTPTFWILLGGLVSVLEVVPLTLMILESYRIAAHLEVQNKPAFYHITGIITLGFIGVALFGLAQTWPWTNWWEHGTWVTPAHGHLCALAFGFGAIGLIYLITPDLAGREIDDIFEKYGKLAFWFMLVGIVLHALIFSISGTIQIYHYRVLGQEWQEVFTARAQISPLLLLSGLLIFIGFMFYAGSILRHLYLPTGPVADGGNRVYMMIAKFFYRTSTFIYIIISIINEFYGTYIRDKIALLRPPRLRNGGIKSSFFETLEGFPILIVLAVIFSIIASTGLWSFSSSLVLGEHNPLLPYTLTSIGYIGMGILALLIALKLIRGTEKM